MTTPSVGERVAAALNAQADAVAATYEPDEFIPVPHPAAHASHARRHEPAAWGLWISSGLIAAAIAVVALVIFAGGPSRQHHLPAGVPGRSSHPVPHTRSGFDTRQSTDATRPARPSTSGADAPPSASTVTTTVAPPSTSTMGAGAPATKGGLTSTISGSAAHP